MNNNVKILVCAILVIAFVGIAYAGSSSSQTAPGQIKKQPRTTIPTTIPTTVSTTIPTVIPTTIPTIIPTTILITPTPTIDPTLPVPIPAFERKGIVLEPTLLWEQGYLAESNILYDENPQILTGETSVFKMWYRSGTTTFNVGYAESTNGINWIKRETPVVSGYALPFVTKIDSMYYLYAVHSPWTSYDLLTSTDGINWSLKNQSVLQAGGWSTNLGNVMVYKENSDWYMLYEAIGGGLWHIGLATSTDGINWNKYGTSPVITEGSRSGPAFYKKVGSVYSIFVHGGTGNLPTDIYKYDTTDWHTWTPSPVSPIFTRSGFDEGQGLSSGQVADPCIVTVNGLTYMYYEGDPYGDGSGTGYQAHIKLAMVDS